MKVKIIILALVVIALSLTTGANATITPVPAQHHAKPVMPLRHATRAPDRGRTHLLKCVAAHNC